MPVDPVSSDADSPGDSLPVSVENRSGSMKPSTIRVCCRKNDGREVQPETCGTALALEHNGGPYPCDHSVEPAHLFGNTAEENMPDLSPRPCQFGLDDGVIGRRRMSRAG